MQPYAIVKNRTYSLPVKCFIATLITTGFVIGYRMYLCPLLRKRRSQRAQAFEEEYFQKLNK